MGIDKFGNPFQDIRNTFTKINPKVNLEQNSYDLDLSSEKITKNISREADQKPDSFGSKIELASNQIFSSLKPGISSKENSVKLRPPHSLKLNSVSKPDEGSNDIAVNIATFNSGIENDSLALINAANLNYESDQALANDNQNIFMNNNKILAAV